MPAGPESHAEHLAGVWDAAARRFAAEPAAHADGRAWTYGDLDERVRSLAGALAARFGVSKGDRVLLMMGNSLEFLLAYWATLRAGGVVCAVNPRLAPREAAHVVRASGGRVLFRDPGLSPIIDGSAVEHVLDRSALLALAEEGLDAPGVPALAGDDLAVLAHTSGTTGEPKIAEVTHANLLFNLKVAIHAHALRREDVLLVGVPMFHCTPLYSLMPAAASLGAALAVTAGTSAAAQARAAAEARASVWFGVPTLFHQLATAPGIDEALLANMRLLAYAGSPMRPETIRRLRERWPHLRLHNFFGLTETISMTHVLPSGDALDRADSVGKLLPGVRARIAGEDGREVPPGEVGELCFHRANVIRAYWARPKLLEQSFRGDWFRTGDLAREEGGYLYLCGRSKDMIIVSGENVYAAEVEAALAAHPAVEDVAVVGVPATGVRASLGELVKAVVVVKNGEALAEREVKRFAAARLTSYKVPHLVEFRDALPRNASGKVLKEELR